MLLTCNVTPYDGLQGYNLHLFDENGAALEPLPILAQHLRHLLNARGHDVIRNDVSQLVEPEEREFRQDTTLVRNALEFRQAERSTFVEEIYIYVYQCDQEVRRGATDLHYSE